MAGLGGEAFGSAIGGFFGGPKLDVHRYIDLLDTAQGEQAQSLRDLAKTGTDANSAYAAAVAASTPQIQALNQDSIGRLGSLADQYAGFDPASTYERIRGGNIASLADQFVKLASLGQEGDKVALAARGYGGRGPGSYESILRSDRISRNIAPVLNTIYGNLGSDTTGLNANRLANLASIMPTLAYRNSLPGQTDARALLPYQAEAAMLSDRIRAGGGLAEASKANVAGYSQTQNKWANFFQQMGRATDQVADTAIGVGQMALSAYTGGAMGGMGGMGGGGGGQRAPAAQSPYGPYAGGYQFPPSASSYGGNFSPSTYYGAF